MSKITQIFDSLTNPLDEETGFIPVEKSEDIPLNSGEAESLKSHIDKKELDRQAAEKAQSYTRPPEPFKKAPEHIPTSRSSSRNDLGPEDWAGSIIKVACILVIGVVILNAVVSTATVTPNSAFSGVFNAVQSNIASGYTLAALMVLALGAGAIMRFLGFM